MPKLLLTALVFASLAAAQDASDSGENDLDHAVKVSDDVLWRLELGGIAEVRTFRYTSSPKGTSRSPLIVYAYSYVPLGIDRTRKHPMVVLVHGGVHGSHMTGGPANSATIVRELVAQGYVVVAPDYRGSTGYGQSYKMAIDYGGKENDDVLAARQWMVERYPFIDPARVGVMGWSHGGMIAFFNVLFHPEAYACAYAGVPVSDLMKRREYVKGMVDTMAKSAGPAAARDDEEYKRRSPVTHAGKLARPLLVHGNTSDSTVRVVEVNALVAALQAAGRPFEHKIYEDAPGGHHFNRIDTKLAVDSRREIYSFLNKHLHPAAH